MSRSLGRRLVVVGAMALSLAAMSASAQDADVTGLHYQTVTPCRLVDTRSDPAGPIATDTAVAGGSTGERLFQVRGKCGVPSSARAVALNLTVPTRDLQFRGHMVAFQANISRPPTSNVNVTPGTTEQNFGIVALAPQPCDFDMKVHLFLGDGATPSLGGLSHLVVDVVGFFFKP